MNAFTLITLINERLLLYGYRDFFNFQIIQLIQSQHSYSSGILSNPLRLVMY